MFKKLSVLFVVGSLSACGGANPGSMDSVVTPESAEANSTIDTNPYIDEVHLIEAAEDSETETGALIVADDFDFQTSSSTTVEFNFTQAVGTTRHLVVCSDFSESQTGYDVNYDSCLLKTRIVDGYFSQEMDIPHQHQQLIGVVWPLEAGGTALYQTFSL